MNECDGVGDNTKTLTSEKRKEIINYFVGKESILDNNQINRIKEKSFAIINNKLHIPKKDKKNEMTSINKGIYLPVVCVEDFFETIYNAHSKEKGHHGQDKTTSAINDRYYGIPRDVIRQFVKLCPICNLKSGNHSQPPLRPIRSYDVFERIQIDLVDMRNSPDDDYKYIAHVIDHFSNYNVIWPLKTKTAEEVIIFV